jgi:glutathione S-transferase
MPTVPGLTVLGRTSSINVRKVLWTLDELGLAYQREEWGLPLRDPRTPDFLALNPNGQVPVLRDGEVALWQSHAIMRHVASVHGGGRLMGATALERARVDQWMSWQEADLNPDWLYAVMALLRRAPGFDDAALIAASVKRWTARMELLEGQLADGREFLVGEVISLADIVIGLSAHRWFATPMQRPNLPALAAYHARLAARPAAREHLDPAQG